jgi:REP element-mobilizing transposase RayT
MPRRLREDIENAVHHVYARGNNRELIYRDVVDRRLYLEMLGNVVVTRRWRCLAYCLMDNHVHLLVETPEANLGSGMQLLHGLYAQRHNRRHRRSGHLFQGRFGAERVASDEQLWAAVAYIAHNPVEAGLCALPEEWPWSSHAAVLGDARPEWFDVGEVLRRTAALGGEPRRRYAELTAAPARAAPGSETAIC